MSILGTKSGRECARVREEMERLGARFAPEAEPHLSRCRDCAEQAQLAAWSHQVLQAGELAVTPPLMSAVWASIHRASEQAWDMGLSRSFRYLLPYMVAVVALIALVGGLTSSRTTAPVQAASTAYSVLSQPEASGTVLVTTSAMPAQDPVELLWGPSRR
ncbi:MAG TPA: hypothetical protein VFP94_10920 [Terriglobales bacterium]|nr:hypothetical protein [Terriglobales bacterium]